MGKIYRTIDLTGRMSTGVQTVSVKAYDNELESYSVDSNLLTFDNGGLRYYTGEDGNLTCYGLDQTFDGTVVTIDDQVNGAMVTAIAENAFRNNFNIKSVTIPGSVKTIGKRAFSGCANLETVTLNNGVTTFGSEVFCNCVMLTKITLPASVRTIGSNVFSGCTKLEEIYLNNGLDTIGANAFSACTVLDSITIPNTVTRIDTNAFARTAITTISIPDTVTYLGSNVFTNCSSLRIVSLGDGIEYIQENMFNGCTSLTTVNIPNSVTSIGSYAFYNCTALESITIPESVENISFNAFKGCTKLTAITLKKIHGWFYTESAVPAQIIEGENCTHVPSSAFTSLLLTQNYANYIWFRINQMPAPEISINNGILSITDYSGMADKFKLYVNSDSFEIPAGKTRTISAGTWLANETLDLQPGGKHELDFVCDGTNHVGMYIGGNHVALDYMYNIESDTGRMAYNNSVVGQVNSYWALEKYRTITIVEDVSVTEECYEFFTKNFTKANA